MQALLLVDLQNDFLPGGALPVPDGGAVIPTANRLMPQFQTVVASQDWHPPNHRSFAAQHPGHHVGETVDLNGCRQVLWPVHCVQDSQGAAFAATLETSRITRVVQKGTDREIDSYSAFFDNNHLKQTELHDYLQSMEVNALTVLGLATDYCVKFTVLDALELSYQVTVVLDAIRGVDLREGDCATALAEMSTAGAIMVNSDGHYC